MSPDVPQGCRWRPTQGRETRELLHNLAQLSLESKQRLLSEAATVLGRCTPPAERGDSQTGLVIGHIQSGKTMSFTTVTALARDNGYRLVIVITGVSKPLFRQSTDRLRRDLRLDSRPDRQWQFFSNPGPGVVELQVMRARLAEWHDDTVPAAERQTILVTVMKNHRHLTNLIALLRALDLEAVPALIIDDEADQAGLNTRIRQAEQSSTYRQLLDLRAALPHHSYLQYTATPQAPLLINLIDVLSPRFAKLLTSGPEYIGGRELFLERPGQIREIPLSEIPTPLAPLHQPPPTLLFAMRLFFLGAAAGHIPGPPWGSRTMLVHPSQQVLSHGEYFHWVSQAKREWERILSLPEVDPDRQDLIAVFAHANDDLSRTVPDLPPFVDLCRALPRVLRSTVVQEVNTRAGATPQVEWRQAYPFILVGGQAMDRGFTVEGLTVTYMPRSLGVGNADTIQQRARFLGYKLSYVGYCRVFLEADVLRVYGRYVRHEEDIRRQLEDLEHRSLPLSDWRRRFFLDGALRPTRVQVLDLVHEQGSFSDKWFEPKAPHHSDDGVLNNRGVVQRFIAPLALTENDGHPDRTPIQRHLVATIPLRRAYEDLLVPFMVTSQFDQYPYLGLQLQVEDFLARNRDAQCTVFIMSSGQKRDRSLNGRGEILQLFQGKNPRTGPVVYPGDREICVREMLTVQVHWVTLSSDAGEVVAREVPALAVWVPRAMAEEWVVQTDSPV
ncbi:MAG TPA: Z1 domain-containing protein [Candidatus Eisenbacteria bacterium]